MKQLTYGQQTRLDKLWVAEAWCTEQWGKRWNAIDNREGTWCVFWAGPGKNFHTYQWWFATEEQLTLFTLRWL